MKKGKKVISLVVMVLVLIMIFPIVVFADGDNIAPWLEEMYVNVSSVKPGETLSLTVQAYDDANEEEEEIISGVDQIVIEWQLEGTEDRLVKQFSYNESNIYEYLIPENTVAGSYKVVAASVIDYAGNSSIYSLLDEFEYEEDRQWVEGMLNPLNFIVEEDEQDTTPPIVTNFKILNSTFTAPGNVEVEWEAYDDSGVAMGSGLSYSPVNNLNHVSFAAGMQIGENTYKATLFINSEYEKYKLNGVQVRDNVGNNKDYTAAELGFENDVYFAGTNYIEDSVAPVLKNIQYNKKKLNLPDTLEVILDVLEEGSGLSYSCANATFVSSDGTFSTMAFSRILNNKLSVALELGEDVTYRGEIYLDTLTIKDKANNEIEYSVSKGNLEKVNITVDKKEVSYTLKTSTADSNYIEKISNLEDGSTVLCNVIKTNQVIKKELFEAIKGKDITVTFMSIYSGSSNVTSGSSLSSDESSMGIKWIINGKDIINETKDIDMVVTLSVDHYNKILVPEYEFDLEAMMEEEMEIMMECETEEEYLEKLIEFRKKEANKYFDFLEKQGYIDVDTYRKNTIALIEEGELPASVPDYIQEANPGGIDYISIKFADNGVLPCKTVVKLKADYATRGLIGAEGLKLYYADGNEYTLEQDSVTIDEDNYYNFTLIHNSEFWLSNGNIEKLAKASDTTAEEKEETKAEEVKKENPNTGDKGILLWSILMAACVLGATATIIVLKKSK